MGWLWVGVAAWAAITAYGIHLGITNGRQHMADSYRTVLGESARDKIWVSTLTGARYRWGAGQWEVATEVAPDWHPVKSYRTITTVYSQAGEKFVEAP